MKVLKALKAMSVTGEDCSSPSRGDGSSECNGEELQIQERGRLGVSLHLAAAPTQSNTSLSFWRPVILVTMAQFPVALQLRL